MTYVLCSAATVTLFLTAHDMWIVLMLAAVAVSSVIGSEQLTYDHFRLHAAFRCVSVRMAFRERENIFKKSIEMLPILEYCSFYTTELRL